MRCALALSLTMIAIPAFADSTAPPPGGVAPVANGGLVISSQICGALAVPSADYQPGVDVNGKAVAPADLPPSGTATPNAAENIAIEIDSRLASRINLPKQAGTVPGKTILGYVTIKDNQPYFNGQPLSVDQRAALAEACRNAKQH